MGKKPLTFSQRLEKQVEKMNKRSEENFSLYAREAQKQGKKIGEPIDLMEMLK